MLNLLSFNQTQMGRITLLLSFLTFTACPILGHGENHHHSPSVTPSPSPTSLQVDKSPEAPSKATTENASVKIGSPTVTTQMPKGVGELIFCLLIASPLALFLLKQRSY